MEFKFLNSQLAKHFRIIDKFWHIMYNFDFIIMSRNKKRQDNKMFYSEQLPNGHNKAKTER